MIGVNSITLYGNLTRDPEEIADGKGATFGIGFNTWAPKGEENAGFVTVKVWGNNAAPVMQYCSKGDPVIVAGRLELEQWKNKEGEKRSRHTINAFQVQFIKAPKPVEDDDDEGDEDIPF